MFPLRFPFRILQVHARPGQRILDPFCGRGTTNYAARLLGLENLGTDSSPVAASIALSKVVQPSPSDVLRALESALESVSEPPDVPEGPFWRLAYHPRTLHQMCRIKEALRLDCRSDSRIALRAIILGALHGPVAKANHTYLSNQSPRTFAPKPNYAVKFWRDRNLEPRAVDLRDVVADRATRYYGRELSIKIGNVRRADSRTPKAFDGVGRGLFDWVITSPPYYGMRTYIPDQWLRSWFLGGPSAPDYSAAGQVSHRAPETFADDLRKVWRNAAARSRSGARMVIRFGGINDRRAEPLLVIRQSLNASGWDVLTIRSAGLATAGKRQAIHFGPRVSSPREEFDVWAIRNSQVMGSV